MKIRKLLKKVFTVIICILCLASVTKAFDYVPKNIEQNPFDTNKKQIQKNIAKKIPDGMREIKNIEEYFRYLPHEVNRNWSPYKADSDYNVTVKFTINRDGSAKDVQIINTTLREANASVLNAVKKGAPYQPLPLSYEKDSVTAQVMLEYKK